MRKEENKQLKELINDDFKGNYRRSCTNIKGMMFPKDVTLRLFNTIPKKKYNSLPSL